MIHDIVSRLGASNLILVGAALAIVALALLAWILSALAAGFYANRLNRSGAWGFLALLVSPLPVFLLLFGLGPYTDDNDDRLRIACPFCAEDIRQEATLCPHCGSDLRRTPAERLRPR